MTNKAARSLGLQPGHWYLCGVCRNCGKSIPVVELVAHTPVSTAAPIAFQGVSCQSCHQVGDYAFQPLLERLRTHLGARPTQTLN